MARFHHVNLGIPVGGEEAEAGFLVDVLGYTRLVPPAELAGLAKWFAAADGSQIHLSEDPDHHPAARAHVAIEVGDELGGVAQSFDESGYPYKQFDSQGLRVLFCEDPAGNRWELRGAAAG